jgi:hypothetical protein
MAVHKQDQEPLVEPAPKAQWTPPGVDKFVAGEAESAPTDVASDGSGTFS